MLGGGVRQVELELQPHCNRRRPWDTENIGRMRRGPRASHRWTRAFRSSTMILQMCSKRFCDTQQREMVGYLEGNPEDAELNCVCLCCLRSVQTKRR